MHRIDGPGHVANKFSEGNPASGQIATWVTAEWLNAVQEEIAAVIASAGIVLDKANNSQLLAAIVAIVSANVGEEGGEEGAVPITREVSGGGLVTGGGPLSANRTLTVAKALAAAILTGTEDAQAITPLQLALAFAGSKSTNGYSPLPGGLIVQWGVGTAAGNSTTVITMPTTFPTANAFAGVEGGSLDTDAQDNNPFVSGRGLGSISVFNARNSGVSINWFSIGF